MDNHDFEPGFCQSQNPVWIIPVFHEYIRNRPRRVHWMGRSLVSAWLWLPLHRSTFSKAISFEKLARFPNLAKSFTISNANNCNRCTERLRNNKRLWSQISIDIPSVSLYWRSSRQCGMIAPSTSRSRDRLDKPKHHCPWADLYYNEGLVFGRHIPPERAHRQTRFQIPPSHSQLGRLMLGYCHSKARLW